MEKKIYMTPRVESVELEGGILMLETSGNLDGAGNGGPASGMEADVNENNAWDDIW